MRKTTTIRLDEEAIKNIKFLALKESRSFNNWIETVLHNAINKAKEK